MLRITRCDTADASTTLSLEGKLTGPWVTELLHSCGEVPSTRLLSLDLTEVTFADPEGVKLLKELTARGTTLANCSGLVAELLQLENQR